MDVAWMMDRLERFPPVLHALLESCSQEDGLWRASEEDWSILEIVCHLIDEDLDDFGTRLRLLLESPESDWPKVEPQAVANERGYRDRKLSTVLCEFMAVRRTKIGWLRTMIDADYEVEARHPALNHPVHGAMSAGSLLASWCAHDALHLRQVAHRLHQLTDFRAGDHDIGYAGDW